MRLATGCVSRVLLAGDLHAWLPFIHSHFRWSYYVVIALLEWIVCPSSISGPDLAMGAQLLSFNRTQTRAVIGLLTGHNTCEDIYM